MNVKNAKHFNFASGDLEAYLNEVNGINIVYRNKMRSILKSEENEMPRIKALYNTIMERKAAEGVNLMNDDFREGFVKLFNMNANADNQIEF